MAEDQAPQSITEGLCNRAASDGMIDGAYAAGFIGELAERCQSRGIALTQELISQIVATAVNARQVSVIEETIIDEWNEED